MSKILTSFRSDAHSYTRSSTPWILEDDQTIYGKLIHYISGGGVRAFGRTVSQEETLRRHVRFYLVAIGLGLLWTLFYFLP